MNYGKSMVIARIRLLEDIAELLRKFGERQMTMQDRLDLNFAIDFIHLSLNKQLNSGDYAATRARSAITKRANIVRLSDVKSKLKQVV